jgi:hypothetical protein
MALNQHDDLETNSKHINNIAQWPSFANFEKVIDMSNKHITPKVSFNYQINTSYNVILHHNYNCNYDVPRNCPNLQKMTSKNCKCTYHIQKNSSKFTSIYIWLISFFHVKILDMDKKMHNYIGILSTQKVWQTSLT